MIPSTRKQDAVAGKITEDDWIRRFCQNPEGMIALRKSLDMEAIQ